MWKSLRAPVVAATPRPPAAPAVAAPTAAPAASADEALDALGAALRLLHTRPLPTGASSPWAAADDWARHLLMGTAAPGTTPPPGRGTGAARDWAGLRRFADEARQAEQAQVGKTLGDMRTGLKACVEAFKASCAADATMDGGIAKVLDRLSKAVQTVPPADLKREVVAAVDVLARSLDERRRRQESELKSMAQRLDAATGELREAQRDSQTDGLTGLFNRRAFDAQVEKALRLRDEFSQHSTLVFFDADHFKHINDDFGHAAGDVVLRKLADTLVRAFPRRGDFVGRYGGEEFVVILADVPLAAAVQLTERCLATIRDLRIDAGGSVIRVTISAGVAQLTQRETAAAWVGRADTALYGAKQAGRDRVLPAP
jgi:diguanylate cyclase (GGDEF)-like protein